ncbi:hypothetical protein [Terriglobus sp. RCC_193]|uniref:hypothetical protein n=1 Tax=Terriglobus sp. RCC_193 TaxID=3239218 RepID=UPI003525D3F6
MSLDRNETGEKMLSLTLSMYDRSRRAAVRLPASTTVGELLTQCAERWQLPVTTFAFRDVQTNCLLLESEELGLAGVQDGAELQLFPLLEGGLR